MSLPITCRSAGQYLLEFLAVGIGKADRGDVIGQRVDPHIHDVLVAAGHADAPVEGGARDREVLQAAAHEARDFVQALLRQHEVRHARVELEQLVLVGREPEEIAFLLDPFDRRAGCGADALFLARRGGFRSRRNRPRRAPNTSRHICRDRCRRSASMRCQIASDDAVVARLGGADEIVVRAIEPLHHGLEQRHVAVEQLPRRQAFARRGLQHLAAVLVGAGEEEHVVAVEPHEARDGVGGDRLIGVADMRRAVRIGRSRW